MKCLLKQVLMVETQPETNKYKQSIVLPAQGLSHFTAPIEVYSLYFKEGIYIIDAMIDAILIAPIRLIITLYLVFIRKKGIQKIQYQIEIVHLFFIWIFVILFTQHYYFEVGLWYHIIRGQSQIKLYGIIQILDLLDRLACTQGEFIIKQLYWQHVNKFESVFNRYMIYCFIYVFFHSCLLGLQLTVYNVILSQGIQLLYLALFVLSLIKLKGSVFKKQDDKSILTMILNDGKETFQKATYIILIFSCVKFTPYQFYYKIGVYLLIEIIVDSLKYISMFHLNNIDKDLITKYSLELSNFAFACNTEKITILNNLQQIDAKDVNFLLWTVPQAQMKIIGRFQFVIIPQVIIVLRMLFYWYKKNYSKMVRSDYILLGIILFLLLMITKLFILYYQSQSRLSKKLKQD